MSDLYVISKKITQMIDCSDIIIENIRQQNIWTTNNCIRKLTKLLQDFFPLATDVFDSAVLSNILSYVQDITDAHQRKDYVLLGDFIELNLLPSFYELQGMVLANIELPDTTYFQQNLKLLEEHHICNKELLTELQNWYSKSISGSDTALNSYVLEYTNCGGITIAKIMENQKYYLHSNSNPWKEARFFVQKHLNTKSFDYTIFGLGLGYHITTTLRADARINLTVVESDINIIGLWLNSGDLTRLLTGGRFHLVYSPHLHDLSKYTTNNRQLLIHYPSLAAMEDSPAKEALSKYFLHYSSIQEQKQSLDENFCYNQLRKDSPIDNIRHLFEGKTAIYMGGGPSTETKLHYIKDYISSHPGTVTVCAGKVYRTLLDAAFTPDYVLITDPKAGLVWQTENIPETKTELLYIATASYPAVRAFQGKCHIFYQSGYPESEEFANEHGYLLASTGGSVSTAAIDLLIQLGCSKVITTGLDLAYPEGKTHAFGIQGKTSESVTYQTATNLHGKQIFTSPTFLAYKEWIEQRIKAATGVEFMNITDGVKIQGMTNGDRL